MKPTQSQLDTAVTAAAARLCAVLDLTRETGQDSNVNYGRVIAAHEELKLALHKQAVNRTHHRNGAAQSILKTLKRGTELLPPKPTRAQPARA